MVQRYERHENQMKGCAAELKVSDWQMIAWKVNFIVPERLSSLHKCSFIVSCL